MPCRRARSRIRAPGTEHSSTTRARNAASCTRRRSPTISIRASEAATVAAPVDTMLLLLPMQPSRPNQPHPRKTATSPRLPPTGQSWRAASRHPPPACPPSRPPCQRTPSPGRPKPGASNRRPASDARRAWSPTGGLRSKRTENLCKAVSRNLSRRLTFLRHTSATGKHQACLGSGCGRGT